MLKILRAERSRGFEQGSFKIRRVRPGLVLGSNADPAFRPLAVLDHANLGVGTLVRFHEHVNDEILSYMWRGTMVHEDSSGNRVALSPDRLMMMNAGRSFWHEESAPSDPVEMLQIFICPREADLPGEVQFHDRDNTAADGRWHLIAAPETSDAPLKIRQQVIVYDAHLPAGREIEIPKADGMDQLLYVFDGEINAGTAHLLKGDALADDETPLPAIKTIRPSTLVAFLVDRHAPATRAGTISGG
ncbi:pirin family protein [Bradyrhizobium sp. JYMT SZCCT0428]|uniref:pirin family protein n=1 Tax=Bradyrhizobium sp. JYMT SZCCT0428 TaxID=2807673 RepID=UPI001BAB34A6|nr:pirin family protein [Bradyrhizobium sp. JYMT SZCCT0428]MBR1156306.1 pirin family protein [Bradyrhizobium sp. JYMT SZCCT0428]